MTSYLYPYIQESVVLDNKLKENYILTIQYSLDGLSFVIFDNEEQKFLCLKHYHISQKEINSDTINVTTFLEELQEKENWKLSDFKETILLIDNNYNTFVPMEFVTPESNVGFLKLLNISNEGKTLTDNISSYEISNIYPVTKDIENINDGRIKIRHTSSILTESLIKEFSERNPEIRAFVNVKNNSYELIVINDSNLIFHNYFNFNTKEDFIYFILFTFEQLKIDNESIPLYFMGFIEEKSPIIELCSRYIRNIRFFSRDNNLNYANELDSIPYYYYYTLYSSISCE